MSTVLSTSSTTLFDARTTVEGGDGGATNLAGLKIGRIKGYMVTNDAASASAVNVYVNGQTLAREIPVGGTLPITKQGQIYLITASAVSSATIYTAVMSE